MTGAKPATPPRPTPSGAHRAPDGHFRNPWPTGRMRGFGAFLRWRMDVLLDGRRPDDGEDVVGTATPAYAMPRAEVGRLSVTWVGHATALIQIGGYNVLTDPMFSARASPVRFAGPRRRVPPGVALRDLPPVDLILLSHNHYDHLDRMSVRTLVRDHPSAHWLAPLKLGAWLSSQGVSRVDERDWWAPASLGALEVTAVPAQHFSGRTPLDRNRTLWCGWTLAAGERRVYFAGDTGYHPEFQAIGRWLGPADAVLLPIGAYEPRWFMRPVHLNPEDAVRAFRDVTAVQPDRGILVPIHWGTFKLTDEPLGDPPRRLRVEWRRVGLAPSRLIVLRHGETWWLVPPQRA